MMVGFYSGYCLLRCGEILASHWLYGGDKLCLKTAWPKVWGLLMSENYRNMFVVVKVWLCSDVD